MIIGAKQWMFSWGFLRHWQESLNIIRCEGNDLIKSRYPLKHYSMLPASGYPLAGCSPAEPASVSPDVIL